MDDHYIYVFVRQDIPIEEQLTSVGHVAYHMGNNLGYPLSGIPNLIMIGVPHIKALQKVHDKLANNNILQTGWDDPDKKYGQTAIATKPLSPQEKTVLSNYRLWNPSLGTGQPICGVKADEGANAAVAQIAEHSISNGEVVRVDTVPAAPIL